MSLAPQSPDSHEEPTREQLLEVLRNARTIAVVGASSSEQKDAHGVPKYLQSQGYRIVPVNPRGGEILGERAYESLTDVDVAVDVVNVFRPPDEAESVARDAVAIGAKVLWFQVDTHTGEAVRVARDAGLTVVINRCMRTAHQHLGPEPGPGG